ncbi:ABC transporter permease subunit [Pontibacillus yanchengensis]|nr:ABC transporter permease subunit [Pontibacillus yanchengensis]
MKFWLYYAVGIVGIVIISVVPFIIQDGNLQDSFSIIWKMCIQLVNPEYWVFIYKDNPEPIFSFLWGPFLYSMQLLGSALFIGFSLAFILAFLVKRSPSAVRRSVQVFLNVFETVPDILFAYGLQLLVVYAYQKFGMELFGIATTGDDSRIYLAPILTIAIVPFISMFRLVLIEIEVEEQKPYVQLAKGKGIHLNLIYIKHMLRNILPIAMYHSKVIVWASLSSLFVISRIFNIFGITYYMTLDFRPMSIACSLIMIFTPFYILYSLADKYIERNVNMGVASSSVEEPSPFKRKSLHLTSGLKELLFTLLRVLHPNRWLSVCKKLIISLSRHMRNGKFAAGSLFLFCLFMYSLYLSYLAKTPIDQVRFRKGEDGGITGGPPHPPGMPFLLGSDRYGFSIADQIIVGAKYTLLVAFVVALLRVGIGFLFGIGYAFFLNSKFQEVVKKLTDPLHFLPLSVVAYILLKPIIFPATRPDIWTYGFFSRMGLEVLILTILVIPLTTVLVGNEIRSIQEKEFIQNAKTLGASSGRILGVHIMPHLWTRLFLLFGRQFNQVLIILLHLGVFNLFFGGTIQEKYDNPPRSVTNEWAGLIGANKDHIYSGKYWMVVWPLLAFMVTIFAMQLIVKGVEEVQYKKLGAPQAKPKQRKNNPSLPATKEAHNQDEFQFKYPYHF